MSIVFHENGRIFHLSNNSISYIIRIMENEQLENIYFGKCLHDAEGLERHHEMIHRSHSAVALPEPSVLSMQFATQEYPVYGTGDYRSPACTIRQENGSRIMNFRFASWRVEKGKPALDGLPSLYCESSEEAETLVIVLKDEVTQIQLHLFYTIFRDHPAIARHVEFHHHGEQTAYIEKALSACLEFKDMDFELVQLSGAWARERYIHVRKLEVGHQGIQSLAGTCSSAEQNPFIALRRPDANESQGDVYGFSLIYSGNFIADVEVSTFDMTRIAMGINPEYFTWKLKPGEAFTTPEVLLVYSARGMNGMSQTYHRIYRTRLVRGIWRDTPRPILLNNWEATFFDFTEEKILAMAECAKDLGVELFVLDDGWFGSRNSDHEALGDWYCNMAKLPSGIQGLSEKIEAMGMKFGLWIEPEMVNENSDLYRMHPDWVIHVPERFRSHSRHQLVLDFSQKEVVEYIGDQIVKILEEAKISYIKWDMNRYMTEPYSIALASDQQGEMMHRYILGVYSLYERLIQRFPNILFESCASGGARFDPGMLYYAPQAWCSDDTDAWERSKIQYGTSLVYPISSMGAHVSVVPNQQILRITPFSTRANIATFGTFGYELDIQRLTDKEKEQVRQQIRFMKKYRRLIQLDSDFHRIRSPFEYNEMEGIVVAKDKKTALALLVQKTNRINGSWLRFRLAGLNPDLHYQISCQVGDEVKRFTAYGDELMYAGIVVDRQDLNANGGDYASLLYEIIAIEQ